MSPVNAFEQHRKLRRCQMDLATLGLRPDEAASFEPFGQQAQAIAGGPQHFERIAPSASEHKHVSAERVVFQHRLDFGGQALESAALMWRTT